MRVAAKVDPSDEEYFEQQIAPLFEAHNVDFVGELGEDDKPAFYAGAAATLFPSDWPEPFGLVMIESLAAGTPVIALRRGSVPEVLVDGVCGFVCDDAEAMIAAVDRLDEIDPSACRQRATGFGVDTMCARYQVAYEALLDRKTTDRHTHALRRRVHNGPGGSANPPRPGRLARLRQARPPWPVDQPARCKAGATPFPRITKRPHRTRFGAVARVRR